MEILILTIPLSVLLTLVFVGLFVWSVDSGQMEGLESHKNIIFNTLKRKRLCPKNKLIRK